MGCRNRGWHYGSARAPGCVPMPSPLLILALFSVASSWCRELSWQKMCRIHLLHFCVGFLTFTIKHQHNWAYSHNIWELHQKLSSQFKFSLNAVYIQSRTSAPKRANSALQQWESLACHLLNFLLLASKHIERQYLRTTVCVLFMQVLVPFNLNSGVCLTPN